MEVLPVSASERSAKTKDETKRSAHSVPPPPEPSLPLTHLSPLHRLRQTSQTQPLQTRPTPKNVSHHSLHRRVPTQPSSPHELIPLHRHVVQRFVDRVGLPREWLFLEGLDDREEGGREVGQGWSEDLGEEDGESGREGRCWEEGEEERVLGLVRRMKRNQSKAKR